MVRVLSLPTLTVPALVRAEAVVKVLPFCSVKLPAEATPARLLCRFVRPAEPELIAALAPSNRSVASLVVIVEEVVSFRVAPANASQVPPVRVPPEKLVKDVGLTVNVVPAAA